MANAEMKLQMSSRPGFIAALDQSGGSTPGALRSYGVPEPDFADPSDAARLIHEMRVRIVSSPAFTGEKVIGAILFEATMDGVAHGTPVPLFLWRDRGVVPFLKVDKGLEVEKDGVQLMKPIPELPALLQRAEKLGVYGTKMRSVIKSASKDGIAAVVKQQFEIGALISECGLMPILEPEVSIECPDKKNAENLLCEQILKRLDSLPADRQVMLKLTIPDVPDLYLPLIKHARVQRVVALSGGYKCADACSRLAKNHGMIASFSRALVEDLKHSMTDDEFNRSLSQSIEQIFKASTQKQ